MQQRVQGRGQPEQAAGNPGSQRHQEPQVDPPGRRPPPPADQQPSQLQVAATDRRHQPVIDPQHQCHGPTRDAGNDVGSAHQQSTAGVGQVFGEESTHRSAAADGLVGSMRTCQSNDVRGADGCRSYPRRPTARRPIARSDRSRDPDFDSTRTFAASGVARSATASSRRMAASAAAVAGARTMVPGCSWSRKFARPRSDRDPACCLRSTRSNRFPSWPIKPKRALPSRGRNPGSRSGDGSANRPARAPTENRPANKRSPRRVVENPNRWCCPGFAYFKTPPVHVILGDRWPWPGFEETSR